MFGAGGDGGEPTTARPEWDVLPARWPLVGRDEELCLLSELVGTRDPVSVVLAGAAGVGKSRLLSDFLDQAGRRGRRTVLVRATRSTATIPFGPFASWIPDPDGLATSDRLHVLRTTARALVDGDGTAPVVAVDDAHLLDDGSAALVLHVAAHTPASVVVTVRTGEPSPDAVVALWKESLAARLELQPLTEAETAELAERVLGGPLDPATRARLWPLTGGMPLYLREVLHAASFQGVLTRPNGVWRWHGDLAGSERLGALMGSRVVDLDTEQRRTLELVAIGEPLPLDVVAEIGCIDTLAEVERHGVVVTGDDGGQPVARLAHPLYGEVLRGELPTLVGRTHHQTLAAAAVAVGWHDRDPLRVASWWLEGGHMPGPPDVFVRAARQALTLGEWPLADRMGQAAEASGAGPEATVIRAASLVHLGGWALADDMLAEVPAEGLDDEVRAEHARLRAGWLSWHRGRPEAGRDHLVDAAGQLRRPARSRALARAAYIALIGGDAGEAARIATEAMHDADGSADLRAQAVAVASAACVLQGQTGAALWLAEAASPYVGSAVAADPYPDNPVAMLAAGHCLALVLDGRIHEAGTVAASAAEPYLRHPSADRRTAIATVAGCVALFEGRLAVARERAEAALADAGPGPGGQWPAAVLGMALAQLGEAAAAGDVLRRAAETSPTIPLFDHQLGLARCWLHAAQGELTAARESAVDVATRARAAGLPFLELLALVDLARLGNPCSAAPRLGELADRVDGSFVAAVAAFAHAAASGDGTALDRVSTRFEAMGAVLLAAEVAGLAAPCHRAAGRRPSERSALARARLLAARCAGARTPALREAHAQTGSTTLTRREHEVVELAARGLTNREIAARLYVSIRTVNAHLGHAYAKLGTSNRHDLGLLL